MLTVRRLPQTLTQCSRTICCPGGARQIICSDEQDCRLYIGDVVDFLGTGVRCKQ